MCCQLAALEKRPANAVFVRKGRGGDAGVECFTRFPDGKERGWQAKYVGRWDTLLKSQLDESIRTALNKHPKLAEYVVCLPFDLPDARTGRGLSPLRHWQKWSDRWIKIAKTEGRQLSIELWSASALAERLSRDDPAYAGRLLYWFDHEALTPTWFRHQFEKSRAALGSRYVPASNVELPIRRDFLALVRDPSVLAEIEEWGRGLRERGYCAIRAIERADGADYEGHANAVRTTVEALVDLLDRSHSGLDQVFPLPDWKAAAAKAADVVRAARSWAYGLPETPTAHGGSSPASWAKHELFRLVDLIDGVLDDLDSQRWRVVNLGQVLLVGEAGAGKSHLLADVVDHQIEAGAPALLILGSMLNESEPWHQILSQLDLPANLQIKHWLGAMDSAAEAAGMRALVCIDAINERHGMDIWPDRLAAFLKEAEPFPRVVVCVSCRTTYLPYVVADHLDEGVLPRIRHQGFGGTSGDAAKLYLDMRGIVRPGAPNLLPEFNNPLFLKTCCDYLEKEGKSELPRGLQGVTSIFRFYIEAISLALNRRMRFDPRQGIVPKAIRALADAFAQRGEGYLPVAEATALFEAIYPSRGKLEDSLLAQLESEGVLAIEPVRLDGDELAEVVRFTFERFSDHEIALRLLDEHLDAANPAVAFSAGNPLFELVCGRHAHRRAGIVEAIAVQLPERVGVELPDLLPVDASHWVANEAFEQSFLWRDQSRFTKRTLALIKELQGSERVNSVLLEVATEPKNPFNAMYLHQRLEAMPMPARDAHWSTFIAEQAENEDGPVETLISWAFQQGMDEIDDDRAELAAVALTWLGATSARVIRDPATKGLACLLTHRHGLSIRLLAHFRNVDDLYVKERLLAAMYGAVLQGSSTLGLGDLAAAVYREVFAGTPPLNALLREHAAGIILYARWRGELPSSVDFSGTEPPYRSPWPIEFVPEAVLETYKEGSGKGSCHDNIVSSTGPHGDFGRYVIDRVVRQFAAVPIGMRLLRSDEIFSLWCESFLSAATTEQFAAFDAVCEAAAEAKGELSWKETPEKAKFLKAESAFQATLPSDGWEDYCVRGRDFLKHGLFTSGWRDRSAVSFSFVWACRWVCKRAHEFGWTSKRFGQFDRYKGHGSDRYDHRIERIGKKYQWLALHELTARMGDNLGYKGNTYGPDDDQPESFGGARSVGLRDIDPSLLVRQTFYDGWRQWPQTWWAPADVKLRALAPSERLAWKDSEADIVNDSSMIEVTNPKDGRHWLVLDGFFHWSQSEIIDGHRAQQRDSWVHLNCLVVRKHHAAKLERFFQQKRLTNSDQLPELKLRGDHYLGEYPWHPSFTQLHDWWSTDAWPAMPVPTRPTVAGYLCEKGGYDYSIDNSISLLLPAPWILKEMGLRLVNGRALTYAGADGIVRFFDPSAAQPGPQAALVDRDAFLEMLEREGLVAIWVIAGEKSVYGGADPAMGWGGTLAHTFVYRIRNGKLTCHKRFDRDEPTAEQMERFLNS